jgi:mycoredoxin
MGDMPAVDRLIGRPDSATQSEVESYLDSGVTIYWRDGCPYCTRMRWSVRKQRELITWVNIWEDPAAAAYVRNTNEGGHETVPTVVIDGVPHTNPSPALVREHLSK